MTRTITAALALAALTGPAMAAPIHHQPPVPVPHGLLLTIDPFEGRHSFNPADGIDAYAGGKTGHLTASPHEPRTVRWPRAGAWMATETRQPHYAGRIWGLPGYPVGFIGRNVDHGHAVLDLDVAPLVVAQAHLRTSVSTITGGCAAPMIVRRTDPPSIRVFSSAGLGSHRLVM